MQKRVIVAFLVFIVSAFLFARVNANAGLINLSDLSSTEGISPDVLDATFDFQVSNSTLTLTVDNQTTGTDSYYINQIYFNSASDVTLTANDIDGWSFTTSESAPGFGTFDYALIGGNGNHSPQIAPSGSDIFTFNIAGEAPDQSDFITAFSQSQGQGSPTGIVAAKFVRGPNDASSTGAAVPIPTSVFLLGTGLVSLIAFKRKPEEV